MTNNNQKKIPVFKEQNISNNDFLIKEDKEKKIYEVYFTCSHSPYLEFTESHDAGTIRGFF